MKEIIEATMPVPKKASRNLLRSLTCTVDVASSANLHLRCEFPVLRLVPNVPTGVQGNYKTKTPSYRLSRASRTNPWPDLQGKFQIQNGKAFRFARQARYGARAKPVHQLNSNSSHIRIAASERIDESDEILYPSLQIAQAFTRKCRRPELFPAATFLVERGLEVSDGSHEDL
jgi:hypothetical protein